MTEKSYFWDGTTVGDATLAPYSAEEIADYVSIIYGTDFVIPDYPTSGIDATCLEAEGLANATLRIHPGAALVKGMLFISDSYVDIVISPQGGGENRFDAIVLRRDTVAQTVRPFVIEGVAGATPALPAITSEDFLLYYLYVPNGFGAATTVNSLHYYDQRVFNYVGDLEQKYILHNYWENSEFMAYSQPTAGAVPPEKWHGAPAGCVGTGTPIGKMRRGQAVDLNGTIYSNQLPYISYSVDPGEGVVTFKGVANVTSGYLDIHLIGISGAASYTIERKYIYITGTDFEWLIRVPMRYLIGGVATSLDRWKISLRATDAEVGQIMVVPGFVPGPLRITREFIMFDYPVNDVSFTNRGPGSAYVNKVADFTPILIDTQAIFSTHEIHSAVSAASVAETLAYPQASFYNGGAGFFPGFTESVWKCGNNAQRYGWGLTTTQNTITYFHTFRSTGDAGTVTTWTITGIFV